MPDDPALVRQWRLIKILSRKRLGAGVRQLTEELHVIGRLADSFGIFHGAGQVTVKVRFLPAVARYVQESRWHDSQQLSPQKDGSLLAEFQLSSIEEIKHWLLGFGGKAIVLEPPELRHEIAAELHEMLAIYDALPNDGEAVSRPRRVPDARRPQKKQRSPVAKSSTRRESRSTDR